MLAKPHALAAEALGTFILTLVVSVSLVANLPLSTPVLAGLTLGLLVYVIGPVSGAHVNPAVTLSLMSIKKIAPMQGIGYIVAQVVGALLAMFVSQILTQDVPSLPVSDEPLIAVAEGIGALLFILGVSSVVQNKAPHDASGIVIGTALALGAMVASSASNGVLNPAVALGIGSLSLSYIIAPVVGGVIAAWLYKDLANRN